MTAVDGEPIFEARVAAQQVLADGRMGSIYSLPTAADGAFLFPRLTLGAYRLIVQADGYVDHEEELLVSGGGGQRVIPLEQAPGLELRVEIAGGGRPAWVRAALIAASGELLAGQARPIDAAGRARFPRLPEGRQRLLLSGPGVAPMEVEADVPGPPLPVILRPAGRLRIRVPALVETDEIASATLLDASGRALRGGDGATTFQLAAGRGVVDGVPSGSWTVRVEAASGQRWVGAVSTPGVGEAGLELE